MLFTSAELPSLIEEREKFHDLTFILTKHLGRITDPAAPNTTRDYLESTRSLALSLAKSAVGDPSMPAFISVFAAPAAARHAFELLNFYLPTPPLAPPPLLPPPASRSLTFSYPPFTATLHPGPPPILALTLDSTTSTPPILLPATPTSLSLLTSLLSHAHHLTLPGPTP